MSAESRDSMQTHASLFGPLGEGDPRAWEEFVERYGPMIRGWCHRWYPREAEDMFHEVIIFLYPKLKKFKYQPHKGRFRGWLKTVTNNLMAELKKKPRLPEVNGEGLTDFEAPSGDLTEWLEAEHYRVLREKAEEKVRGRVELRTWMAFEETAVRGRKPAEVARELHMKVGAVYQARYAVLNELRREVASLEGLP
jgi:RNA polymerase sigma-70 factor (ECF subfamily)